MHCLFFSYDGKTIIFKETDDKELHYDLHGAEIKQ